MRLRIHDPLIATLLLAGAVHALVIWGVDFRSPPREPPAGRPLDVTLAVAPSDQPPEDAQRLAAASQQASGLEGQARTPPPAALPRPAPVEPDHPERTQAEVPGFLTTLGSSDQRSPASSSTTRPRFQTRVQDPVLRAEIARLSAEIARQESAYLEHPRTRYLHTLSAKAADEAEYVRRWVRRVEEIGNLHYPDAARRRRLSGKLIVHVLIGQDGRLLEARVGIRSGHQVLDDAALRIVQLAAPFEPFPQSMRKRYSRLMITRTWEFRSGSALTMH